VRAAFYGAALLLAALSESLFLLALGAAEPWEEAGRGLLAGALLALVIDIVVQLGRRRLGRWGMALSAALLVAAFVFSPALRPYEAIVLGRAGSGGATPKPDLMLMSALPLAWGELGPLDPGSRPAAAYGMLEREFAIRHLDVLEAESLGSGKLLLLAQPRALAPTELVALDAWVRGGGNALILTDPTLAWPSQLALGDIRRPPAIGLLEPLLDHWGLKLEPPASARAEVTTVGSGAQARRLTTFAAGKLTAQSGQCTTSHGGLAADCRLGAGRAIVIADADMLNDRLWVGSVATGAERHARTADNPLVVADRLDELGAVRRARAAGDVQWLDPAASRSRAITLGLVPLLLAAALGLATTIRRRR
jgi:hypothetical protein